MFGFSLTKLIFTVLAGMAVWYGFKLFIRIQEMREDKIRASVRSGGGPVSGAKRDKSSAGKIKDMVNCKVCDAYVIADSPASCGRDDCPYA